MKRTIVNKTKSGSPSGDVLTITSLSAAKGDIKSEIDLNWDGIDFADTYMIEYCNESRKQNWVLVDIINESKYTIKGLRTNKTYSFRVRAVNSQKQGPWSETVIKELYN